MSSDSDPVSSWLDTSLLPILKVRGRQKSSFPPILGKRPHATDNWHTLEGHAKCSVTFVKPLNQILWCQRVCSITSLVIFMGLICLEGKGGEMGVVSQVLSKGKHSDPNRKCDSLKTTALIRSGQIERTRAQSLVVDVSPSRWRLVTRSPGAHRDGRLGDQAPWGPHQNPVLPWVSPGESTYRSWNVNTSGDAE